VGTLSPTERGQYLDDLADALEDHAERHAEMDVRDNGKPIREMRSQHESIPEYYRFYAGLADKIRGRRSRRTTRRRRCSPSANPSASSSARSRPGTRR